MIDDKLTLSRRQVLGGAATIGVAGAVGAGTWAQMSDEETASVSATAGSIDLSLSGGRGTSIPVEFGSNLQNGNTVEKIIELTNGGTLPGEALCFSIENFTSNENGNGSDAETKADGNAASGGELEDVADLTITLFESGEGANHTVATNPLASTGNGDLGCINLNTALEDQTYEVEFILDIPDEDINQAMGDSFSFDLVVTLYDNEQ